MQRRFAPFLILVPLLGACGDGGRADAPPTPIEKTSPTTSPTTAPSPSIGPVVPVAPEHGGTYWAVYLAVGDETQLEDAIAYLSEERDIQDFSVGDVACDEGASEALPSGAGPQRVAVYFASEDDARAWSETLPASPVAIAEVRTFCLD